ncbi:MAG: glycosyltransferase [Acidobacteria bacterium]|nr:glycosyltransferase [Acidobacteriota bacterium]
MAKPIRVVRIIDRLNIGGPAKHVAWLSAELNAAEFHTTLITGVVPQGEGDMSYFAEAAGVRPLVIQEMSRELGLRDVLVIGKLLRMFFQLKPQIIHTHKAKAGAAGRVAALLYKWLTISALWLKPRECKIVHTFHGHIFHSYYGKWKTRLFIFIESLLARFCSDRIITISAQQRQEISAILGMPKSRKFQVIPLGIDFDEVRGERGALRNEYQIADEEIVIGIVGRLCEVKNHQMFLAAAAQLVNHENDHSLRFVIIGDGHLRQRLQASAQQLGIAERVIFTGFRKDAAALYADLDVVALTSLNEGTPLTLIEAMSCGRAVVATEVGGVVDIMGALQASAEGVKFWQHGATVSRHDAAGFARALQLVIAQPDRRRQMAAHGQAYVKTKLSKARLLADVEMLYRNLLGLACESKPDIALGINLESAPK